MMGEYGSMGDFGWGFGFGGIFMIFWWVLIIVGIIALVKRFINPSEPVSHAPTPLDILKERYALGEIEKEEFDKKRQDLEH